MERRSDSSISHKKLTRNGNTGWWSGAMGGWMGGRLSLTTLSTEGQALRFFAFAFLPPLHAGR